MRRTGPSADADGETRPAQTDVDRTMLAVQFASYGAASVIGLRRVSRPAMPSGHVLVRMVAASVNPKDTFVRKGRFRRLTGKTFPLPSGYDGSGVVEASSDGRFQQGDRVFGMLNGWRGGAAAEFVAWPVSQLSAAPRTIPLVDAAAIPLAGLTALRALRDHLRLRPGQKILINGASGGVGGFAIQFAKALGATVTAVCSAASASFAGELGADAVHDYANGKLPRGRFDGIFDVFGNLSAREVAPVLAERGRYVTTVPSAANMRAALIFWSRPRTRIVSVTSRSADLAALAAMIDGRTLRVRIDARFPAAEVADAHSAVETKHTRGKVLLLF